MPDATSFHGDAAQVSPVGEIYRFPVTRVQRRLWLHERLGAGTPQYLIPALFEVRGPLDHAVLDQAIDDVVARHEALRTWFEEDGGEPVQVVGTQVRSRLEVMAATSDEAMRIIEGRIRTALPLGRPPLHRWLLIRTGAQRALLLLTIHHIVCDGWSIALLAEEVAARYRARAGKTEGDLPELQLQFPDYAVWEVEEVARTAQSSLAWWQATLGPSPMPAGFPSDRPRPVCPSARGAKMPFAFDAMATAALREIAASAQTSLFGALAASLALLLRRFGAGDRPVIGVVGSGRGRPELERVVGMFATTLPVPVQIDAGASFRRLAADTGRSVLQACAHHDWPLEEVAAALSLPRQAGRMPLVDCVLTLLPPSPTVLASGEGLTLERVRWIEETGTAKFDLAVALEEHGGRLSGSIEYALDLYDQTTVERIAQCWQTLVADIARRPEAPVAALEVLPEQELSLVASDWSRGPTVAVAHDSFVTLFEQNVRKCPEAVAVFDLDEPMTWSALEERSRQIASALLQGGLHAGDVVAVALERSPALVCAFLGVLRSGGVYLPLDLSYPSDRLSYQLSDSGAQALIARGVDRSAVAALAAFKGQAVDPDDITSTPRPLPAIGGDDAAYVIYTSGSTGRPKGVAISHRSLANLACTQPPVYGLTAQDRLLLWASPGFDGSIWEMAVTLGAGAALVTAPREELKVGPPLARLIAERGVSAIVLPPSVYASMSPGALPFLRIAVSAGEPCPLQLAQQWSLGRKFFNAYGPTEATVCTSVLAIDTPPASAPSIGRPLPNVRMAIVDRSLHPVPIGVEGELLVGGAGVAIGYLNRPELNADKFLDALPGVGNGRWYRTGDLARWRPDGTVEFRGRIDRQVKLRGIRIELDEIAQTLRQLPAIDDCSVVVQNRDGEQELVAFVVTGSTIDTSTAAAHLRRQLPPQYIPRAIVPIDRLPLTAHGKVDHDALAALPVARRLRAVVAPRNEREARLADIWREQLRVHEVGIDESFFELGGHSLLAMRMLSRVRTELGIDIGMRRFLEQPTIETLAEHGTARSGLRSSESALPAQDAALEPGIRPASTAAPTVPAREIFLTGATGFLGIHLLRTLLDKTEARVHALVRASDDRVALNRLLEALARAGLTTDRVDARVVAHAGNLAAPMLGLARQTWTGLAASLDAIVHAGALVRAGQSYGALRQSNVEGTRRLIQLACEGGPTALHFISTLSAFPDGAVELVESELPEPFDAVDGGYAQSKWVAERLITAARERGLRCTVIRPGRISASTATGASNPSDLAATILRGCVRLGLAPQVEWPFEIAPVDRVAEAIVAIVGRRDAWGGIFHLGAHGRIPFQELAVRLSQSDIFMRLLPYDQWRGNVLLRVADDPDHPLFPLLPLLEGEEPALRLNGAGGSAGVDQSATLRLLGRDMLAPSRIDESTLLRLARLEAGID